MKAGLQRGVGYRLGFGWIQGMMDMGRKEGIENVPRFPVYGTLWEQKPSKKYGEVEQFVT